MAKAFKEALKIPIIATNTIKNPAFAEQMLEEGVCDFVGLGRSQIADPDFVRKAKEGREDEIRQCIGCMVCRERLLAKGLSVVCAINPGWDRSTSTRRTPGMAGSARSVWWAEAPPVWRPRGCWRSGLSVVLFEKEPHLGGALNLADKPPHKELITRLTKTMTRQLEVLGVDIRCGEEATPEMVQSLSPEAVFVAAGSAPIVPGCDGADRPNVHTAEDVVAGRSSSPGVWRLSERG